ncbi:hypothetical protein [Pseudobacteriovorax antillogorgiicola]|nr:hypothetical protein [Pseudobacteriovorax antillogorgiicola]
MLVRIWVMAMGWSLIWYMIPRGPWGTYALSLLGLSFGTFTFGFYHTSLLELIIAGHHEWSWLEQKNLYGGLILGFALQGVSLLILMVELRRQVVGWEAGLYGLSIWLGLSATVKLVPAKRRVKKAEPRAKIYHIPRNS